jgi:hypothetical protein
MQLTPFERAQRNRLIHIKRAKMTIKIADLVKNLEECELYLATAKMMEDDNQLATMFTPELIDTVKKEVRSITATLVIMADLWEDVAGVSA